MTTNALINELTRLVEVDVRKEVKECHALCTEEQIAQFVDCRLEDMAKQLHACFPAFANTTNFGSKK